MTFFQRMQAKTAESSRYDPALQVRSDNIPSPTSSLTAASPRLPAYTTSMNAPTDIARVTSSTLRLSSEAHTHGLSPIYPAEMPKIMKENVVLVSDSTIILLPA